MRNWWLGECVCMDTFRIHEFFFQLLPLHLYTIGYVRRSKTANLNALTASPHHVYQEIKESCKKQKAIEKATKAAIAKQVPKALEREKWSVEEERKKNILHYESLFNFFSKCRKASTMELNANSHFTTIWNTEKICVHRNSKMQRKPNKITGYAKQKQERCNDHLRNQKDCGII